MATRRELIQAIAERYRAASRIDKRKILDEFTEVTGFHRKHAIRALRQQAQEHAPKPTRPRLYQEAVVQAVTILWEAAEQVRRSSNPRSAMGTWHSAQKFARWF